MFIFTPCQVGAETVLKNEVRRLFPELRPAFARPGFVSFKRPRDDGDIDVAVFDLLARSVFARSAAMSIGSVRANSPQSVAEETWKLVAEQLSKNQGRYVNRIHVYGRDSCPPGDSLSASSGRIIFEPGMTKEARVANHALHQALFASAPNPKFLGYAAGTVEHPALLGETVLNVVRIDPGHCMAGLHTVMADSPIQAYYPGGILPIVTPPDAVSRAWLKFEEGLRWSGFPIGQGACCLDIGAAPGGGSQALLSRGAAVLGVDPAEMAPVVLDHPNFTHIRGKINQVKRSLFKNVRWAIADMNVAPNYTLEVLEELLARRDLRIQGLLFTLKLFQWKLADDLPKIVPWFRRWRFDQVRVKQLAFNRQEVMVAAIREK